MVATTGNNQQKATMPKPSPDDYSKQKLRLTAERLRETAASIEAVAKTMEDALEPAGVKSVTVQQAGALKRSSGHSVWTGLKVFCRSLEDAVDEAMENVVTPAQAAPAGPEPEKKPKRRAPRRKKGG